MAVPPMIHSQQIVPGITFNESGQATIDALDQILIGILAPHVKPILTLYDGNLGNDD